MKNTFKIITAILLIAAVITGCDIKTEQTNESGTMQDSGSYESASNENNLYDEIFSSILKGDTNIVFADIEEEDVIKEYKRIVREHPELFWIGDGYSYETRTDSSGKTVTFECAHIPMQNITQKRADFDSVVEKILNGANAQKTLYEKVIYIHDYIVDNTQYDKETYKKISGTKDSNEIYEATTAYGCLVNKKAVCSGYSAAFQVLMQGLGVECGRVSGRKTDGESHEWNYIVLDNDYYYVDVTWDDPINDSMQDKKTYEFFCITTDELEETHEINKDGFVPDCTARKYDYYIYRNLYLDQYSFDEFKKIYNDNASDDIAVKFSTARDLEYAVKDLIDGEKIYEIAEGKSRCSYSTGSGGRVLSIKME